MLTLDGSTGITNVGNLTFTGTGNRITGDFSNGLISNRVLFQTSTANSNTKLGIIPSGTATQSQFNLLNSSDSANSNDYADYLAWLAIEGNVPEAIEPVVVFQINTVSMKKARLALLQAGLLSQVNAALDAMTGGEAARISWNYSNEVNRTDPLIGQLGTLLNLTSIQIDDLFTTTSTL